MPLLLIMITIWAALAQINHIGPVDQIIDFLTGVCAVMCALIAGGRLNFDFARQRERVLWECLLVLFVLAALGELLEPLGGRIEQAMRLKIVDDALMLAIGPIMFWIMSRIDPAPTLARVGAIVAFVLQVVATGVKLLAEGSPTIPGVEPGQLAGYGNFAELLAIQFYLVAVFLILAELKRLQFQTGMFRTISTRLWPPPFRVFAPKRYRDQPIACLRANFQRAFMQSVSWWELPMVALATLSWPLAIIAISLGRDLPTHGPRAKAASGRSYFAQFLDHLVIGLSANLWPRQYYMFELFRDDLRPRAYEYLRRVETKRALYKLLRTDYREEDRFRDKLRFFRACAKADVQTVPVVLAVANGRIEHPEDQTRISLPRSDLFIKPYTGRGGEGTEIARFRDGHYQLADGSALTEGGLIAALLAKSHRHALLVQPRLVNHPLLTGLNMNALSTVRIDTATDTDGRGRVISAALRLPSKAGSLIDNFHAGGIAAAVDLETGRLGEATDLGIRGDSRWHSVHPVTGGQIKGVVVPDWPRIMQLAELAHARLADRIVLGWDVAVLPDGPCIIEANAFPDLDINQRTTLAPLGNSRLGQLMAYHLENRDAGKRNDGEPDTAPAISFRSPLG